LSTGKTLPLLQIIIFGLLCTLDNIAVGPIGFTEVVLIRSVVQRRIQTVFFFNFTMAPSVFRLTSHFVLT